MALQDNAAGEKLVFKFGDAATPTEAFTASCSINTERSLKMNSDVFQGWLADCANPSAPKKPVRRVKGIDISFTGAGVADPASFKVLKNLWLAAQPFNGKVIQDLDPGLGWTITGPWVIVDMQIGGTKGEDQAFDINLAIAGDFDWEDN